MKTYATASNAKRAARSQITDVEKPLEGEHFEVEAVGDRFTWRRIQTEVKAPTAPAPKPVAPPEAEGRHCPACEIDIDDNGYDQDDKTGALTCLGCGHQWGGEDGTVTTEHGAFAVTTEKKEYRKGAVREVWDICDANKDLRRKDVIEICVSKGINFYTARTQYQAWRTAMKNSQ